MHVRAQGVRMGDEYPAYTSREVWHTLPLLLGVTISITWGQSQICRRQICRSDVCNISGSLVLLLSINWLTDWLNKVAWWFREDVCPGQMSYTTRARAHLQVSNRSDVIDPAMCALVWCRRRRRKLPTDAAYSIGDDWIMHCVDLRAADNGTRLLHRRLMCNWIALFYSHNKTTASCGIWRGSSIVY